MNYSDLIIVGYAAGYGGDFFSSLLLSNFKQHKPTIEANDPSKNKYDFSIDNSVGSLKSLDSVLGYCSDLIEGKNKTNLQMASIFAKKHISLIWDNDPNILVENLIEICRQHVEQNNSKVINFHYHENMRSHNTFKTFSMESMFPGSTKLRLVSNTYYHDLFTLLYVYKTNAIIENIKMGNTNKDFFIECALPRNRKEYIGKRFEDFIDVSADNLFFKDERFVGEVEEQLSDVLKIPINLNKDFISTNYKPKNIKVLETILGTGFDNNSEEQNTRLVLDYVSTTFDEQLRLYKDTV